MYRVLRYFTDALDNGHAYHTGDEFPRDGVEVSEQRIEELSTSNNKLGVPLISEVDGEIPAEPKKRKTRKKG